jgi:mono/diheme cytochrome c family protein
MTNPRRSICSFLLAVLAASIGALVVACDNESEVKFATDRFRSGIGPVPATPQRAGDAAAGYRALVNAPYVDCGMPYRAYRRVAPEADPEDLIAGRLGRNAELPYSLTAHVNADGVEVVSSNCLICHAARFDGDLVVGLGNEFLDFTGDPRGVVNEVGAYVRGETETAAWQRWADRIDGIAPYTQTATVGVNPATNLTWALMAHRDPETLAWSSTPLIEPPPREPLPVSVPPWWRMKNKHAMFYTTLGRGDHARFMILASILCADSVEEAKATDAYAADIRAFITSLEPPVYPFPIDASLAQRGQSVFEHRCSRCHGTYGDNPSYPNLVISIDVVGTDPEYALAATDGRRDRFYEWTSRSYYGEGVRTAPARGYIAPPLDGVWATAPYLHNGSVPDVRSLLDSRLRPRFWRHRDDPRQFDPETLGWRYERLRHGQSAVSEQREKNRIYETTATGYGNGGHVYGDTLTDGERTAVIEYLKTL